MRFQDRESQPRALVTLGYVKEFAGEVARKYRVFRERAILYDSVIPVMVHGIMTNYAANTPSPDRG